MGSHRHPAGEEAFVVHLIVVAMPYSCPIYFASLRHDAFGDVVQYGSVEDMRSSVLPSLVAGLVLVSLISLLRRA